MAHKHRSRPVQGRLVCDKLPGTSQSSLTQFATQTQFLIAAHSVRAELVAMVAGLAFGGHRHG